MKKLAVVLFLSCLAISLNAHGNDEPHHQNKHWQNPSPLTYAYKQDDNMVVFHGTMTLDGMPHLAWLDKSELIVSFSPNPKNRNTLPFVADEYHKPQIGIKLNQVFLDKPIKFNNHHIISAHQALPDSEQLIKAKFTNIPVSFWQQKTGEISRPAYITINAFGMDFECDSRQYYATTISIEPLAKTSARAVGGC